MQYITEQQIDQITTQTGKLLQSEPKIRVTIKPEHGETHWEGGINGHFFRIRTDVPVAVPASLAKLIQLSNSVRIESERAVTAFRKGGGKKVS